MTPKPATPLRETYSFDGFGINGPDEYRTRILTIPRAVTSELNLEMHAAFLCKAGNAFPALEARVKELEAALKKIDALVASALSSDGEVFTDEVELGNIARAALQGKE